MTNLSKASKKINEINEHKDNIKKLDNALLFCVNNEFKTEVFVPLVDNIKHNKQIRDIAESKNEDLAMLFIPNNLNDLRDEYITLKLSRLEYLSMISFIKGREIENKLSKVKDVEKILKDGIDK